MKPFNIKNPFPKKTNKPSTKLTSYQTHTIGKASSIRSFNPFSSMRASNYPYGRERLASRSIEDMGGRYTDHESEKARIPKNIWKPNNE